MVIIKDYAKKFFKDTSILEPEAEGGNMFGGGSKVQKGRFSGRFGGKNVWERCLLAGVRFKRVGRFSGGGRMTEDYTRPS